MLSAQEALDALVRGEGHPSLYSPAQRLTLGGRGRRMTRRGVFALALSAFTALGNAHPALAFFRGGGGVVSAMRAYDFYSKFGVNGNLDSGGSVEDELADMNFIGIMNIREGIPNVTGTSDAAANWFSSDSELSAAGVRQHFHIDSPGYPVGPMSDWLSALKTYIVTPYGANMVTGVDAANEPNIQYAYSYEGLTGVAAANAAQQDLYSGMKADPELHSIPGRYVSPRLWLQYNLHGALSQIGNQTAYCDRGNLHDYYCSRQL